MVGRKQGADAEAERDDATSIAEVMTASRALVSVAARSLAAVEHVVTLPQYRALVVLAAHGPQNVGALAEALAIHPSTATRLCDRLVVKGLIERTASTASRREVTVALASEGRALLRSVTAIRRREIARTLDKLTDEQRRQVGPAFATFAAAAGETPDAAWRLGWST